MIRRSMRMMTGKSLWKRIALGLLVLFLMAGCICFPAEAAEEQLFTVQVTGKYGQTEARSMLAMINAFRTGSEAFYVGKDNTTTVTCNNLDPLVYDYGLEQIAMQRAMEIALSFEHTRPNGETCFTAYTTGYSGARGENIAAGYSSASSAFVGWKEDNQSYEGQGHRRNMLNSGYRSIGIGHVYYNGVHYWVQEFSGNVVDTNAVSANDSETTVSVEVASHNVKEKGISVSADPISVTYGQEVSVPTATAWILLKEAWPGTNCPIVSQPEWSGTSNYYVLNGNTITGKSVGTDTIIVTVDGLSQSVNVSVEEASISSGTVTLDSDASYTYTGSAITPAVSSVVVGGIGLEQGTDYDVTYSNNINAGTAYVVVTGKGNYKGSITKAFSINPSSETSSNPSGGDNSGNAPTENGAGSSDNTGATGNVTSGAGTAGTGTTGATTPSIGGAGTGATGATTPSTDATGATPGTGTTGEAGTGTTGATTPSTGTTGGAGVGATAAGTPSEGSAAGGGSAAVVTGGEATDSGESAAASDEGTADKKTSSSKTKLTTKNTTIKLAKKSYTYDGKAKTPTVKVYNSKGKVIKAKYYTVTYKNNTKVGKATLTIKFKGKYTGTIKATYTIKPKATALTGTSAKTDRVTLTWKKQTKQVTGYQIQYAANSKFTKNKTTVLVKGAKKPSETITGLSGKTTYYFRIRTYKTVDGKKYYSAWSKAQTVKTK